MYKACPRGEADSGLPIIPLPDKEGPPPNVQHPDDDVPEDETYEQELIRKGKAPKKDPK